MSIQITTAFQQEYKDTVFQLSQQKESRLVKAVNVDVQSSEIQFYDQVGPSRATKKTTRHSDTPRIDVPHERRAVKMSDYEWADLIDKVDQIRTLNDFTNPYVMSGTMALNRAKDEEIIQALGGGALSDKDGSTTVVLPSSSKLLITEGGNEKFNYAKYRAALALLKENEAIDDNSKVYCVYTARAEEQFMDEDRVINADFNSGRFIDAGFVPKLGQVEFIRTELLTDFNGSAADDVKCYMFTDAAIRMGLGQDITARVTERDDKSFSVQAFLSGTYGAVRMEEKHVIEIPFDPTV